MIPFGSQRALGQDLATHLLNTQDNERMEVAQVRGAVARDLHGAFAEWEAQAHTLTRCSNYLYSLSINPDQRQGRLTKEQYLDYIDRAENRLGLAGQPRAVVFHIKKDKNGVPREHCHVVWSRIDAERGKARHMAFDHDKLMMVTREFARDHGLTLPDGYYRDKGQERPKKNRQLTLYEKNQQDKGGLSKEQHIAQVTAAWQKRDTPRAFVRSLEDMGYILATGTRDYVLVDLYGNMNSLPKLVEDKKVRIKQVREFLAKEFPKDSLPSVDEARALAAGHRAAMELFRTNEQRQAQEARRKESREALQRKQEDRRAPLGQESKALADRQRRAGQELATRQKDARAVLRQGYLQETKRIRLDRAAHRPQGLAAFIGRITGVELITKKIQQYRDRPGTTPSRSEARTDGTAAARNIGARAAAGSRNADHAAPHPGAGTGRTAGTAVTGNGTAQGAPDRRSEAHGPRAVTHRTVADAYRPIQRGRQKADRSDGRIRKGGGVGRGRRRRVRGSSTGPSTGIEVKIARRRRTREPSLDPERSAKTSRRVEAVF